MNIAACWGCGDTAASKFSNATLAAFGLSLDVNGYAGMAYEVPTADSYSGPFSCFGLFGSAARLLPRFPLTPDVTICASPSSGTTPGAYTWTKSLQPTQGPSFGFSAAYSYYTPPLVIPLPTIP